MIKNITSVSMKNCIVDEIHLREKVNPSVDLTPTKELWQSDTFLMPRFLGNLEAGNIDNAGFKIKSFKIKRRRVNEPTSVTITNINYIEGSVLEYTDYTQTKHKYVYSIIPIGTNDAEGQYNEITIEADFAGWYVYDKDTNKILQFDKFIGSENSVETTYNNSRVQIDTMSKFPSIYFLPQAYHTFSLSTVILPTETENSGAIYTQILNDFIRSNKPFLIKGSSGEVYVCSLSNLRKSAPQNTYKGYDYATITVDAIEVMDVDEYTEGDLL